MTPTAVLTLIAVVLSVDAGSVQIDAGRRLGLRAGDTGSVYYKLQVRGVPQRIEVGAAKVIDAGDLTAHIEMAPTAPGQIQPGYLVRFEIPRERFAATPAAGPVPDEPPGTGDDSRLRRQLDEARAGLVEANRAQERFLGRVTALESDLGVAVDESRSLTTELRGEEEARADLEESLHAVRKELEAARQSHDSLTERLRQSEQALASAQGELAAARGETDGLREASHATEADLRRQLASAAAELDDRRERLEAATASEAQLQKELTLTREQLARAREGAGAAESGLRDQLREAESRAAEIKRARAALAGELEAAQEENQSLNERLRQSELAHAGARGDLEVAVDESRSLTTELRGEEEARADLEESLHAVRKELEAARQSHDSLTERLRQSEQALASAQGELAAARGETDGLREASHATGYVLVPVVVHSREAYVEGLTPDHFRLYVDGKRVITESFEEGPSAPVGVIFMQDLSGSMGTAGKLELSRQAIDRFLRLGRPGDHFALASFSSGRTLVEVSFTSEPANLREPMQGWRAYGTTALHDAVWRLPEIARGLESAKKAAILITDGVDNASRLTPEEARQRVRRAELPVYVLGLSRKTLQGAEGSRSESFRYADLLRLLAQETGGAYFSLTDPRQLARTSAAISRELRHQYVLGFSTSGSGGEAYRRLDVEVTGVKEKLRREYRLTFRRGYLGRPPAQVIP